MKKARSFLIVLLVLYFIWSAVNVTASDSNHMGSPIDIANEYLQHELNNSDEDISPELLDKIEKQTGVMIVEGKLGYQLLTIAAFKLILAGIVLIFIGLWLLKNTN